VYKLQFFTFILTIAVSEIERDIGRKSSIFHTPFNTTPPLGGLSSKYRHPVWCGKTRMVYLSGGEKKFEDIFIRFPNVTDMCHLQTPHHGIYRAYALHMHRAVNNTRMAVLRAGLPVKTAV